MCCDVTVVKYQRNLLLYSSVYQAALYSPSQYFQDSPERQFLNRNRGTAIGFLNKLPLFEAYGQYEPAKLKVESRRQNKILKKYTVRQESETLKRFNLNKEKLDFDIQLQKSLSENGIDYYKLDKTSVIKALRNYSPTRNMDDADEYDGLLSKHVYSTIECVHFANEEGMLRYMNNFYEFCYISVSRYFAITSFNVEINRSYKFYETLNISVIYTYCGISYKLMLKENFMKKGFTLKTFLQYNNLIEIMIDIILEQEINGRFVYYVENDAQKLNEFYCAICLSDEPQASRAARSFKCGHALCEACLKEWVNVKAKCPYCNTSFSCFQRYPKWQMYQSIFMSKYWKLRMLLKEPMLYTFLKKYEKSILKASWPTNVHNLEFISLLIHSIEPLTELYTPSNSHSSPIDKHLICVLDGDLSYTSINQGILEQLVGFSLIPKQFCDGLNSLPYNVLLFLGDYMLKFALETFNYEKVLSISTAPKVKEPFPIEKHTMASQLMHRRSRPFAPENDPVNAASTSRLNHSAPTSLVGFVKDYIVSGTKDYLVRNTTNMYYKAEYGAMFETHFANYYRTYYKLYNDWIALTVSKITQDYALQRVRISIPIFFGKSKSHFQLVTEKHISDFNKVAAALRSFDASKRKRPIENTYIKRLDQAVTSHKRRNQLADNLPEIFVMELVLTLSSLADMSVIVYKEASRELTAMYRQYKIKEEIEYFIESIMDLQFFNDYVFAALSPTITVYLAVMFPIALLLPFLDVLCYKYSRGV